jgi:hypothetical protein
MKILRVDLIVKVSIKGHPTASCLTTAGDGAQGGWSLTGTPWGVRAEKGEGKDSVHKLIPWACVKTADYDPASVK